MTSGFLSPFLKITDLDKKEKKPKCVRVERALTQSSPWRRDGETGSCHPSPGFDDDCSVLPWPRHAPGSLTALSGQWQERGAQNCLCGCSLVTVLTGGVTKSKQCNLICKMGTLNWMISEVLSV